MTVAKGITSAYVPLSACIVSEKVWDVIATGSDSTASSATATPTRRTRSPRRPR